MASVMQRATLTVDGAMVSVSDQKTLEDGSTNHILSYRLGDSSIDVHITVASISEPEKSRKCDFATPDWENAGRVHDWMNYIGEDVREKWHTFSNDQQKALFDQAEGQADLEDWD